MNRRIVNEQFCPAPRRIYQLDPTMNTSLKRLPILLTSLVITVGATSAFGSFLELIPTLAGDTTSQSRAITSDGKYVVGVSSLGTTTSGFLWTVGSGAANATWVLSSDGAGSTLANGVGYRTVGGSQELIISGMSSGYVTEWMTPDGGASFGVRRRNTSYTLNTVNSYNQLGSPGNNDVYYVSSRNSTQLQLDINRGSGAWPATITTSPKSVTSTARMNGVGATGAAVGRRNNGTYNANYRMDFNPSGSPYNAYFPGLNTVQINQGEAYDVSDDGLYVVGISGLGTDTGNNYAYKAKFSGTTWQSTSLLPLTGLETGSTTKTVPYGISPDGGYVVGGSYQGIWHALLWNTYGANPADWSYLDLTQYATSMGILDGWTSLSRGWSVGVDPATGDAVITGEGVYGGVTRAFVMMVPEPSAAALAGMGLAALLVLRRRK